MTAGTLWYLDTSVVLRIIIEGSNSAREWFNNAYDQGDLFISSDLLKIEACHIVDNAGYDDSALIDILDAVYFAPLDKHITTEALSVGGPVGGADSIHIATALRFKELSDFTLVTHDAQMARAAARCGLSVLDPVIDDAKRRPVA